MYLEILIVFCIFLTVLICSSAVQNKKQKEKKRFFKFNFGSSCDTLQKKQTSNTFSKILIYAGSGIFVASGLPIIAGFGAGGIVAGSIAAGLQAGIGNVAAGGLFATITSLGMKGAFIAGTWGGGAIASVGALKKFLI